jgi:plastocyanin
MHIRNAVIRVVALMALAGCGSGTGPTGSGGGAGGGGGGSGAGVAIRDFSFSASTLTIKVGTTVTWTNNGPSAHTTTSDTGVWDSGTLGAPSGSGGYGGGSPGGTYSFTFNTPGTYTYHCKIHPPSAYPGFVGTIMVTQ